MLQYYPSTTGWLPARIALAVMGWFGFINLVLVRNNISVAIVEMVKRNTSNGNQAACPSPFNRTGSTSLLNAIQSKCNYFQSMFEHKDVEGPV